jgi:hypothetical protein
MKVGNVQTTYRVPITAEKEERGYNARFAIHVENQITTDPHDPIGLIKVEWEERETVLVFRRCPWGCSSMAAAQKIAKAFLEDFAQVEANRRVKDRPLQDQVDWAMKKCDAHLNPTAVAITEESALKLSREER